ncbi:hypothetical protein [Vitreoscilla stercoraria]|uniref:Uncharacterized protein n=1 Tax=Vitreoscilla stercoraria TaxID=61 RepID=A0ABY4ED81_VITST|nr:hypothetical protein [Vitreoscilla stercoraria]UOO93407.1 hypothetical protein LVJ81_05095 [Vitreoscilla stercoraria]
MMNIAIGVQGRFQFTKRNAVTHEVTQETDWMDNIVLNSGLDLMAAGSWFGGIALGTGNSTPVVTQTDLDARFAASTTQQGSTVNGVSSEVPYYGFSRKTFRFAAGVFNNTILSEVGILSGNTSSAIINRALITDAQGNPTSITMLADEYLDVTVEVRVYPNASDQVGSIAIMNRDQVAQTVNYTIRPANINQAASYKIGTNMRASVGTNGNALATYSGAIGAAEYIPSGTNRWTSTASAITHNIASYVGGSFKTVHTVSLPVEQGNTTFSSMLIYTPLGLYQIGFDTPISKVNTQTMRFQYVVTWGRKT